MLGKNMWKFAENNKIQINDKVGGGHLLRERDEILSTKFEIAHRIKIISKADCEAANR